MSKKEDKQKKGKAAEGRAGSVPEAGKKAAKAQRTAGTAAGCRFAMRRKSFRR